MSHLLARCLGGALFGALAVNGCAPHASTPADDDATGIAQDGSDASAVENDAETVSSSFIGGGATLGLASAGEMTGGQLAAANVGDGVKANYSPAGCVTVTNDTARHVVTYVFDKCSGPAGIALLTGTVTVDYTLSTGRLDLHVAGTGLRVNKATLDLSADATISAQPLGGRTMTWHAQQDGTTARGKVFSRTSTKTIEWTVGQDCVRVSGSSDGSVGARSLHTDIVKYSRCRGQCPAAGSEIRITNTTNGKFVDILYDGGNQATFTASNGSKVQIALACGL